MLASWKQRASQMLGVPLDEPQPVSVRGKGRAIATSVWGRAWCAHLERYSDFENRLPRGRTYLRRGAVLHVGIEPGVVRSIVLGTDLYAQRIEVRTLDEERRRRLAERCRSIEAAMDLVSGRLPGAVLESISDPTAGLFPQPKEIELTCSCPDWAYLCKHLAAVLYGIGIRFDRDPGLLFALRGVDPESLVGDATHAFTATPPPPERRLGRSDLAALFDVEIDDGGAEASEEAIVDVLEIDRSELIALGVSASRIQTWLRRGLLSRTEVRGTYAPTEAGWAELEPFLAADDDG